MKIKYVIAVIAVAVTAGILGSGAYFAFHRKSTPHVVSTPIDKVPIKLANDSFTDPTTGLAAAFLGTSNTNGEKFLNEIDANTRRTTNSEPAGHIKCLVEPTSDGSADYLKSLPSAFAPGLAAGRLVTYPLGQDSALYGKHVRISGWIRAKDVRNWAGVNLVVANLGGELFRFDGMYDRPIHGTTDWQQFELVTDIPKEDCIIVLTPTLYGTGEIWTDDVQIDIAPDDLPNTDDRTWHVWSQDPLDYTESVDYDVKHDGHPSFCIQYVSPDKPAKYAFVWYGIHNRDLDKFKQYLGRKVRLSIWAKSDGVFGNAGLNFEPKGPGGKTLTKSSTFGKTQVRGTTDWTLRTTTCVIPKDTQDFQTAIFMFGPGKLWIDKDSFKCEIVK